MEAKPKDMEGASVRRRKIRRRKVITVAVVVVIIAAVVTVFIERSGKQDNLGKLVTAQVERATITQKISATGSVSAQTGAEVKIGSQITGRIKRLLADVGTRVKAGQVIAQLDLPDMQAQLDQALASLSGARLKLTEQQSGVGFQETATSTGITLAQGNLASSKAAYNQAVQNAKLEVSTAQAAVTQAQATAQNADTFLKRDQQLLGKGYIAAQDVDNAKTQADVAAAQLDSAKQNLALTRAKTETDLLTAKIAVQNAQAALLAARSGGAQNVIKAQQVAEARAAVVQAGAQVDYWRAQFAKTVIQSPISGTVITLDVQQGETVAAGLSAPTLIRVVDLNRLQVDAFVDETDIGNVRLGQPANVTVDAYPNRKFRGRVVKIASGSTMQQNVVTYDTTIALENPGGLLKPDMTATADIMVGVHEDVIAVPIEAVKLEKAKQVVYVLQGKRVVSRPVVTGVSNETLTEIRSGLNEGDTIVLAGYEQGAGMPGGGPPRMTPFGPAGGGRPSSGAPRGGGR